jgi:potassium-transporting ATPase KdpC subunit
MIRQFRAALTSVLVMAVVFGFIFPMVITAIAQVGFRHQANGSLITRDGKAIGSEIIGQSFVGLGYFHPRPSAAGSGYDAASSGGTNLGPTSDKLINGIHKKLPDGKDDPGNFQGIKDLAAAYRKENGLRSNTPVPADAVTRSASGLDPDISPENAYFQAGRVAEARGMTVDEVKTIIRSNTQRRTLGVLGEPRVNVLKLNMALDATKKAGQ